MTKPKHPKRALVPTLHETAILRRVALVGGVMVTFRGGEPPLYTYVDGVERRAVSAEKFQQPGAVSYPRKARRVVAGLTVAAMECAAAALKRIPRRSPGCSPQRSPLRLTRGGRNVMEYEFSEPAYRERHAAAVGGDVGSIQLRRSRRRS